MDLFIDKIEKSVKRDKNGKLICGLNDTSKYDELEEYEEAFFKEMDLDTGLAYVIAAHKIGATDEAFGVLLTIDEDKKPALVHFLKTLILICEANDGTTEERARRAIERYADAWYSSTDEITMLYFYYHMQLRDFKEAEKIILDTIEKDFCLACAYKLLEVYFWYGMYEKAIKMSWRISWYFAKIRSKMLNTEYETIRVLSYCYLALEKYIQDNDTEALRSSKEMLYRYLEGEHYQGGYADRIEYFKRQFDTCPL